MVRIRLINLNIRSNHCKLPRNTNTQTKNQENFGKILNFSKLEKSNYHMDPLEYRLISFKIIFTLIQELNQAYTDGNWSKVTRKFRNFQVWKIRNSQNRKNSKTEPNQGAELEIKMSHQNPISKYKNQPLFQPSKLDGRLR